MKNLLFILLIAPSIAMVQPGNMSSITKAIKDGNADQLAQYFDSNIEVSILDEVYNKAQATSALKQFFAKKKPTAYNQVHKGVSKGQDSQYTIGNLNTSNVTYRVYILTKKTADNKQVVEEIRIDED